MGQQQLLVLVFSIVLVGGLVVAGAHVVEGGKHANNSVLVFQEALAITADIQFWMLKTSIEKKDPTQFGVEEITFSRLDYSHTFLSKRVHKTDFACYMIRTREALQQAELSVYAPSCAKKDFVTRVVIGGPRPDDLDWLHTPPTGFSPLAR